MTELEYWKQRCELAEKYIEETPCDPDIYEEQIVAYNNWTEFKKLPIPVVVFSEAECKHPRSEQLCVSCKKETATHGIGTTKTVCGKCWNNIIA